MKDIVDTIKDINKNQINEFIIINANQRYRPQLYNMEYSIIMRSSALIETYNDFYFTDEKIIPIQLIDITNNEANSNC